MKSSSTSEEFKFLLCALDMVSGRIDYELLAERTGMANAKSARSRMWRIKKKAEALVGALPNNVKAGKKEQKTSKSKGLEDNEDDDEEAVEAPPAYIKKENEYGFAGIKPRIPVAPIITNTNSDAIVIKDEPEDSARGISKNREEEVDLNKYRGVDLFPRPKTLKKVKTEPGTTMNVNGNTSSGRVDKSARMTGLTAFFNDVRANAGVGKQNGSVGKKISNDSEGDLVLLED